MFGSAFIPCFKFVIVVLYSPFDVASVFRVSFLVVPVGMSVGVQGFEFRLFSSKFRVYGLGLRVESPGLRVQASGVRVWDCGFRI